MPTSSVAVARDLAEIRRSAEQARHLDAIVDREQVQRYLNPPAKTPYGLEYAFYLLGDIRGLRVLDLGCGIGESLVPLAERGANVTGIDISPDLIRLARQRMDSVGAKVMLTVGSAYETGLADESFDIIFCKAVIHHLEIQRVRAEMLRILRKGGCIVLTEPVRFSGTYARVRKAFRPHANISEYEHPLTRQEFDCMTAGLGVEGLRFFRLPFVPLVERWTRQTSHSARTISAWIIDALPPSRHFATSAVMRLRKRQIAEEPADRLLTRTIRQPSLLRD